jgi:hypothetical protein
VAIVINFSTASDASYSVNISWATDPQGMADGYLLQGIGARPEDWYEISLNGQPIVFESGGPVPPLPGDRLPDPSNVTLPPSSIMFVHAPMSTCQ